MKPTEQVFKNYNEMLDALLNSEPIFNYTALDIGIIYSDCHKNEHKTTRLLNAKVETEAHTLIHTVKRFIPEGYNGFELDRIAEILFTLAKDSENQVTLEAINKLKKDYTFHFGREGSPVLYIRSKNGFWIDELAEIERASKADEISIQGNGELRIWWD